MDATDVKNLLSANDIYSLLSDFGGEPRNGVSVIVSRTCCHNPAHEGSHKLIYYPDSKSFRCYTGCGSFDVFGLVSKVLNLEFSESFRYVCMKFGISYFRNETDDSERVDMSFIPKLKRQKEIIQLNTLDKSILNTYYDLYHHSWIDEGIRKESMKKFGIKYAISDNQIIIPHFDINGGLIGVRARNFNEKLVDDGKKYMPVYYKKQVLKHPTGAALYGLDKTKEQVEKYKAIILFESEKSVMQLDSMIPDMSIGACVSGSSLTYHQVDILNSLDIDEVIVAPDKEFEEIGSQEEQFYAHKIRSSFIDKLQSRYRTSVIWDVEGQLKLKDSPTDRGLETFNKLFQQRIRI